MVLCHCVSEVCVAVHHYVCECSWAWPSITMCVSVVHVQLSVTMCVSVVCVWQSITVSAVVPDSRTLCV